MMDRQAYIDDYGLSVDPLFDMVDKLEQSLTECRHDKAKGMEGSLARIAELEDKVVLERNHLVIEEQRLAELQNAYSELKDEYMAYRAVAERQITELEKTNG